MRDRELEQRQHRDALHQQAQQRPQDIRQRHERLYFRLQKYARAAGDDQLLARSKDAIPALKEGTEIFEQLAELRRARSGKSPSRVGRGASVAFGLFLDLADIGIDVALKVQQRDRQRALVSLIDDVQQLGFEPYVGVRSQDTLFASGQKLVTRRPLRLIDLQDIDGRIDARRQLLDYLKDLSERRQRPGDPLVRRSENRAIQVLLEQEIDALQQGHTVSPGNILLGDVPLIYPLLGIPRALVHELTRSPSVLDRTLRLIGEIEERLQGARSELPLSAAEEKALQAFQQTAREQLSRARNWKGQALAEVQFETQQIDSLGELRALYAVERSRLEELKNRPAPDDLAQLGRQQKLEEQVNARLLQLELQNEFAQQKIAPQVAEVAGMLRSELQKFEERVRHDDAWARILREIEERILELEIEHGKYS